MAFCIPELTEGERSLCPLSHRNEHVLLKILMRSYAVKTLLRSLRHIFPVTVSDIR